MGFIELTNLVWSFVVQTADNSFYNIWGVLSSYNTFPRCHLQLVQIRSWQMQICPVKSNATVSLPNSQILEVLMCSHWYLRGRLTNAVDCFVSVRYTDIGAAKFENRWSACCAESYIRISLGVWVASCFVCWELWGLAITGNTASVTSTASCKHLKVKQTRQKLDQSKEKIELIRR